MQAFLNISIIFMFVELAYTLAHNFLFGESENILIRIFIMILTVLVKYSAPRYSELEEYGLFMLSAAAMYVHVDISIGLSPN